MAAGTHHTCLCRPSHPNTILLTDDAWTPGKRAALAAVVDALLPSLPVPHDNNNNNPPPNHTRDLRAFYETRMSTQTDFLTACQIRIDALDRPSDRQGLHTALAWLSTRWGTQGLLWWLLERRQEASENRTTTTSSSSSSSGGAFPDRAIADASRALRGLETSPWREGRKLFQGLKQIVCGLALTFVDTSNCRSCRCRRIPVNDDDDDDDTARDETTTTTTRPNPFWAAMGYPGARHTWSYTQQQQQQQDSHDSVQDDDARWVRAAMARQAPLHDALEQSWTWLVSDAEAQPQPPKHASPPQSPQSHSSTAHPHRQLDCDIVLVGSGAGGCAAARALAEQSHVVVLEQGRHVRPVDVSQREATSLEQQYDRQGWLTTMTTTTRTRNASSTVAILAGAGVGGGTAVNWSCALPLPERVRDEWVEEYGLGDTFGADSEYDTVLQDVWRTMIRGDCDKDTDTNETTTTTTTTPMQSTTPYNLSDDTVKRAQYHNRMNRRMQAGCDALGYEWQATGQNLRDPSHPSAGYVGMGDRQGNKRGGVQAYLVQAIAAQQQQQQQQQQEQSPRCTIFEQCTVNKILTSTPATTQDGKTTNRRSATGVACTVTHPDGTRQSLEIRARRAVIVAAGSLHTPCLLHRSGWKRHPHVGQHLRLHPVAAVAGFYPSNKDNNNNNHTDDMNSIGPIQGAPMTSCCNEFANGPNHDGYGAKIECPVAYPGLSAAAANWMSPQSFRKRLLGYRNCTTLITLQRDSDYHGGGSVRMTRDGGGLDIRYTVNERDKASMLEGIKAAAKILAASGAHEVTTSHVRDKGFETDGEEDLSTYLDSIQSRGMKDLEMNLFSAHQMGSCRMSASPETGVVDPNGEVWDCDDLYIMDTSVFPTASGANPMITAVTISQLLSQRLALRLKLEDELAGKSLSSKFSKEEKEKARKLKDLRLSYRALESARKGQYFTPSNVLVGLISVGLVHLIYWIAPAFLRTPDTATLKK